jgi:membrane-bound lytic murein transglycosylase D
MRVWWRYHKVAPGDTLASVARKYHTTATAVAQANSLKGEELARNAKLVIPIAPGRPGQSETVTYSKHATRYKVRKGDTVLSVADDFAVPAQNVRKWNHLKGNTLPTGRVLLVYRPLTSPELTLGRPHERESKSNKHNKLGSSRPANVVHRVRKGETLSSIASTYQTTVTELRRRNGKVAANLRAGTLLVVPSPREQ